MSCPESLDWFRSSQASLPGFTRQVIHRPHLPLAGLKWLLEGEDKGLAQIVWGTWSKSDIRPHRPIAEKEIWAAAAGLEPVTSHPYNAIVTSHRM